MQPDVTDNRAARFTEIAELVYEPLQRYARRRADPGDVDDVVADTLLVVWRRLGDVPAGGELPWCYGVARRCLANRRRGEERHLRLIGRLRAQPVDAPPDDASDADARLHTALAGLSPTSREVLQLWAWEGLEPREIAAVLGVTANAVSIRLHRAQQQLKKAMGARKDGAAVGQVPGGRTIGSSDE
jgi:RNA polymerase sigma-70 factor (ECF subfamily)